MIELGKILQTYNGPQDLAAYSTAELRELAAEVRAYIIAVTEANGGHLASNLGVVELTIALLKNFDFKDTQIVWDVGHQSYAYKILTDRKKEFMTLRRAGGLAGFPKRSESPVYDAFNTGHSTTSVSAAIGLARAAKLQGRPHTVIAVIGDGAMTGGLAWEAMNNILPDDDILIILNDNQMSIAPNVGSFSRHLKNIRVNPNYLKLKPKIERSLLRCGVWGRPFIKLLQKLKQGTRNAIQPGNSIFEALGIRYYGLVDGHDQDELQRYLSALKLVKGPRMLHIATIKGKGYLPAETSPADYHGVAPYYIQKGKQKNPDGFSNDSLPTDFTTAFGRAIVDLAATDESICAITAAMPSGTGLTEFAAKYPRRFFDVGIAEAHAVTFASALAAGGIKPVVAVYSTFLQRAYDQIIHDCCLQNLAVTFCLDRAGLSGQDGETHQGLYDLAALLPLPNLRIFAPATYYDLKNCLSYARYGVPYDFRRLHSCNPECESEKPGDRCESLKSINEPKSIGPAVIRYPKGKESELYPSSFAEQVSETAPAPRLVREGASLMVLAVGPLVGQACQAAEELRKYGITLRIIDPIQLKPLDKSAYERLLLRDKPLLIIEEGSSIGGFGSYFRQEMAEILALYQIPCHALGIPDIIVEHDTIAGARKKLGLDATGLVASILSLVSGRVHNENRFSNKYEKGLPFASKQQSS